MAGLSSLRSAVPNIQTPSPVSPEAIAVIKANRDRAGVADLRSVDIEEFVESILTDFDLLMIAYEHLSEGPT